MADLKSRFTEVVEELRSKSTTAATSLEAQSRLLDDNFLELVRLAQVDPPMASEPSMAEGEGRKTRTRDELLEGWSEGRYLFEELGAQIRHEIRYLLEDRHELEAVEPLHRLPSRAEIDGVGSGAAGATVDSPANPTGERFREVFPLSDPDGWLVVRKFPDKAAPQDAPPLDSPAIRLRDDNAPAPFETFEKALADGTDVDQALAAYLEDLRAQNGHLPVRTREWTRDGDDDPDGLDDLKRRRRHELAEIRAAFAADGVEELVEAGGLDQLARLLESRDRAPRRDIAAKDLDDPDKLWPLASIWYLVLRAAAGDNVLLGRAFPELDADDVKNLGLSLDADACRQIFERLPRLPPNAFLGFFTREEILARRRGDGPLADWTCGVKDTFGLGRTTAASAILQSFDSAVEATAVTRLRDAGCLFPGKTNLDEFALGSSNETSAFKPTPGCPANRLRVAGGSSGGSAAAVGAGLVRFALGSDTAGSIRIPSSYCGVVGWKPSYGVIPRQGLLPLSMGLDTVGTLTRNVDDCIEIASVLLGDDDRDETTVGVASRDFVRETTEILDARNASGEPFRVGVPIEYFLNVRSTTAPLYADLLAGEKHGIEHFRSLRKRADEVRELASGTLPDDFGKRGLARSLSTLDKFSSVPGYWDHFAAILEQLDAEPAVEWRLVSLPHTWLSIPTYFALSRAELASCLHRYDGITFGSRSEAWSYRELQRTTRSEHFGIQPKLRILMGIHALRQKLALESEPGEGGMKDGTIDSDFLELSKRARRLICDDFNRVFEDVDLLLTPTNNVLAPIYGGTSDSVAQQRLDELTVPANLAGTAAITLPSGTLREARPRHARADDPVPWIEVEPPELPTSVQLIAPRFEDARLLAAARLVEGILNAGDEA